MESPSRSIPISTLVLLLMLSMATDALEIGQLGAGRPVSARTTFNRFEPLALAGDPDAQNLLGFMLFKGEGVETRDQHQAHRWFHLAADQGHRVATRNLGIIHSGWLSGTPDALIDAHEANFWLTLHLILDPRRSDIGQLQQRYLALIAEDGLSDDTSPADDYFANCAGCHGLDRRGVHSSVPPLESSGTWDTLLADVNGNVKHALLVERERLRSIMDYLIRSPVSSGESGGLEETVPSADVVLQGSISSGGERLFKTFCSGCHGLYGISYYINSPSFALGERMNKSDAELKQSIGRGRGVMPSWGAMLTPQQIDAIVAHIRTLAAQYDGHIEKHRPPPPELFFRFRPLGETGAEWRGADPRGVLPPGAR